MITVAGEALIDLIVDPAGHVEASPGGGPFNVVRAVARLGQPAAFLGCLSGDRFGRLLRASLDHDGVRVAADAPVDAPTTLAVVDVNADGVPSYHFHLAGTSGAVLEPRQARAALPAETTALHIGSLGLVMEPVATSLEQVVAGLPGETLLMLDPNCRPAAIPSREAYSGRLGRILRRVDLVKTSTEDLAYLYPGSSPDEAAARLLAAGPASVVITDGPGPVRAFTPGTEIRVSVPPAEIADTVGAGDAFGGAFLTWWVGNGLGKAGLGAPAAIRAAMLAAIDAAAVTCARRGGEPPWARELAGHPGWDWLAPEPAR